MLISIVSGKYEEERNKTERNLVSSAATHKAKAAAGKLIVGMKAVKDYVAQKSGRELEVDQDGNDEIQKRTLSVEMRSFPVRDDLNFSCSPWETRPPTPSTPPADLDTVEPPETKATAVLPEEVELMRSQVYRLTASIEQILQKLDKQQDQLTQLAKLTVQNS